MITNGTVIINPRSRNINVRIGNVFQIRTLVRFTFLLTVPVMSTQH